MRCHGCIDACSTCVVTDIIGQTYRARVASSCWSVMTMAAPTLRHRQMTTLSLKIFSGSYRLASETAAAQWHAQVAAVSTSGAKLRLLASEKG